MIALGRGRRLAGAWAVPEDDMDEREGIVVVLVVHSFFADRKPNYSLLFKSDHFVESMEINDNLVHLLVKEEEQGAGSGMLQLNSDEKESEKVVYVIVAICLLGFVQEHLGGGVAEEDADESPSHSFAEEDEEVRFFFHAYCSCN